MQIFTQVHKTVEPLKTRPQKIYFKKALALELMAENESEAFGVCLCEKTRIVNNLL